MQVGDIYVSAPGKAILHGEHAVVHGKVTSKRLKVVTEPRCPPGCVCRVGGPSVTLDCGLLRRWLLLSA